MGAAWAQHAMCESAFREITLRLEQVIRVGEKTVSLHPYTPHVLNVPQISFLLI